MKFKVPHWAMLVLLAAQTLCTSLATQPSFAAYAGVFASVAHLLGAVLFALGVTSGSALTGGGSTPGQAGFARVEILRWMTFLTGFCILGPIFSNCVTGCAWLNGHPVVKADLARDEKCVADELVKDANAGDTPVAILIDVGVACGQVSEQTVSDVLSSQLQRPGSKQAVLAAQSKPLGLRK